MPIRYKDEQQRNDVNLIIDALLDNARDALMRQDAKAIYDYIFNKCEPTRRMDGSAFGKLNELLITEICPDLLSHLDHLFMGMFYECGLTEITIPANIQKFEQGVFALSDIRTINYLGTKAQWLELIRNSVQGWDIMDREGHTVNDMITVNCSDEEDIYGRDLSEDFQLNEAMTKDEVLFKRNVIDFMAREGFLTFSRYLKLFHFNFLTSKEAGRPFIAAIAPEKRVILINPYVDADAISLLLRHEAGHQIFKHNEHMLAKLKAMGIDTPSDLAHQLANTAGDYDIANQLYDSEDDYYTAKHIDLGDDGKPFLPPDKDFFEGLVTALDFPEHPEYQTMDFDQLWDIFVRDYDRDALAAKELSKGNKPQESKLSDDYVEGWNKLMQDYNSGKITKAQIERWIYAHN